MQKRLRIVVSTGRAAVSPSDPTAAAARKVLREHLGRLIEQQPAAQRGDVEGVHQLRVATRRARATLRLFSGVLPTRETARANRSLVWLGGAIGEVRDLDVLGLAVAKNRQRLDPTLQRALRPLEQTIAARRRIAHAHLLKILDSSRYATALGNVDALSRTEHRTPRDTRLSDSAAELVRPVWLSARRAAQRLQNESSPDNYHRLRVRVKRLRYALESLQPLGGKKVRRTIKRMQELQDLLGASQDAATQTAWLRAYAEESGAPTVTLLAIGALIQVLTRRGRRGRARALKAWKDLEDRSLRSKVLGELSQHRRPRLVRAVS
jgi:CHAD domain-containing protein